MSDHDGTAAVLSRSAPTAVRPLALRPPAVSKDSLTKAPQEARAPSAPSPAPASAKPLPPIPMSRARMWLEFRTAILPYLVFAVFLAATIFLWRRYISPPPLGG